MIGVGAVGRQVAIQLAACGVPRLTLVDFDTVEAVNLAPQGYFEQDLGRPKVEATFDLLKLINSEIQLTVHNARFSRRLAETTGGVIFCCVDSIETRKLIWKAVGDTATLFIDGRMAAEVLRVLTASDPESRTYYPTTLFTSAEAYTGACTAKSTIYTANIVAGLMTHQFTRMLRKMPLDKDLQLNLLSSELSVS